jgi:hypothetical protein
MPFTSLFYSDILSAGSLLDALLVLYQVIAAYTCSSVADFSPVLCRLFDFCVEFWCSIGFGCAWWLLCLFPSFCVQRHRLCARASVAGRRWRAGGLRRRRTVRETRVVGWAVAGRAQAARGWRRRVRKKSASQAAPSVAGWRRLAGPSISRFGWASAAARTLQTPKKQPISLFVYYSLRILILFSFFVHLFFFLGSCPSGAACLLNYSVPSASCNIAT